MVEVGFFDVVIVVVVVNELLCLGIEGDDGLLGLWRVLYFVSEVYIL